jgi:hypothetical protein
VSVDVVVLYQCFRSGGGVNIINTCFCGVVISLPSSHHTASHFRDPGTRQMYPIQAILEAYCIYSSAPVESCKSRCICDPSVQSLPCKKPDGNDRSESVKHAFRDEFAARWANTSNMCCDMFH